MMMDKRRVAGLVCLYFHDGLTSNIKVTTYPARQTWDNRIQLWHRPSLSSMMQAKDAERLEEVMPGLESEIIELDEMEVEGIRVLAGYSDRLQMLYIAQITHD